MKEARAWGNNMRNPERTEKKDLNISAVLTHRQHVRVDVGRVHQPGDRLHEDEERDDHEEEAVDEAREDLNAAVPANRRGGALTTSTWETPCRPFERELYP